MIAYKLEWEDLLIFSDAMSICRVGGLLTSAGFYFSYFRERYPGIVDYDSAIRLAYRSKEEFCAYCCREDEYSIESLRSDRAKGSRQWINDAAALFHDLYLC